MNILLTSVGRRNYIVSYFQEALKPFGGKVFAVNSSLDSPAMWIADGSAQSPLIYDIQYPLFLLNYCLENDIKLVISLFDIDLPVLSKHKEAFIQKGITIVVGDEWLTKTANDKWLTQEFLKTNDFETVKTFLSIADFVASYNNEEISFPVFVKPRWGMGSISVFKASDMEELQFYFNKAKKEIANTYLKYESLNIDEAIMIQAAMEGQEYGIDVINDLEGNYITAIVKQKLVMRSGETDVAVTVDEPILKQLAEKLGKLSKHPGNMDVDVFFDGKTPYILELNPRFGGGYPFSHQAGINLPNAIVHWHLKRTVNFEEWLTPKIGVKSMKGIAIISQSN